MNVHPSVSFRFGSALAMVVTAQMMVARSGGALACPRVFIYPSPRPFWKGSGACKGTRYQRADQMAGRAGQRPCGF